MLLIGELINAVWRKSSYSSDQGECVEVAHAGAAIGVRDSKNVTGPALLFPVDCWQAFLINPLD